MSLSARKAGPYGFFGKIILAYGSGIFPESLACGDTPLTCLRIGNDRMFHHLKQMPYENK